MGLIGWLFGRGGPRSVRPTDAASPRAEIQWRSGSFPMSAVGESFYVEALERICGGRSRAGYDLLRKAIIQLDPTNEYDPNAVKVLVESMHVAHLSREDAARVGGAMRALGISSAACAARITGGWRTNQYDEGDFSVRLGIPNRGSIDFGGSGRWTEDLTSPPGPPPAAPTRPRASDSGPLIGEWVAIMGAPRDGELAQRLAAAGARIMADVGKSTTTLVVAGDAPPYSPGTRRSAAFRKAEAATAAGSPIRIVSDQEALALLENPGAAVRQ